MSLKQAFIDKYDSTALLTGDQVSARYESDWSGGEACLPEVVMRPDSTRQLAEMLKACNQAGQKVVTQGGLTGLSGGAIPQVGEWSLSLERMNRVVEVDTHALTMTVEAGVPLEKAQQAAAEAGYYLALDLGARGSCQIGGNIATNAGGNQVIKYGMARNQVSGMVVVLADGTVLSNRNKLLKNNAGYDLKHLFIGSEGTLGVITEVVLRLSPRSITKQSALCAMHSMEDVITLLNQARTRLPSVSAFEVMWDNYYDLAVAQDSATRNPFASGYPFYVLLESEGFYEVSDFDHFCEFLADLMGQKTVRDAAIAQSVSDAENFWNIRDAVAEILPTLDHIANFDIGIDIGNIDRFAQDVAGELEQNFPNVQAMFFGHLGDGNLHVIAGTESPEQQKAIYHSVYELVGRYEGSITAEHGVGTHKKQWLTCSRQPEEIALMRTLKQAMDPKGILNANRVFNWEESA